jgi:hypothetical protein
MPLPSPFLTVILLMLVASPARAESDDFFTGVVRGATDAFKIFSPGGAASCLLGPTPPPIKSAANVRRPYEKVGRSGTVSCFGMNPVTKRTEAKAGGLVCTEYQGLRPNSLAFGTGHYAALLNGGRCQAAKNLLKGDPAYNVKGQLVWTPRWLCLEAGRCKSAALAVDVGPGNGRALDASGAVCGDLGLDLRRSGGGDPFLESVKGAKVFDCPQSQAEAYIRDNPCKRK